MSARVYVETTIPSFYFEIRSDPEIVAHRDWTREWWDNYRQHYSLVTSIPVIEELEEGEHPKKPEVLCLISALPILPIEDPIQEIVAAYIEHQLMPSEPPGDAIHLALAAYHRCQFLLTWNEAYLESASKFETMRLRHLNTLLGLHTPVITTPIELIALREK